MRQEDIDRVEEIWFEESVRVHNWMQEPNKFWDKKRPSFRDTINESDVRLVYDEDAVVKGFIIKWQNGYIPEIFVDHLHRAYPNGESRKIGRALVDYLKASNSVLTATVYMLNHTAIKFYIKNDFVITNFYVEEKTGFAKLSVEWNEESVR